MKSDSALKGCWKQNCIATLKGRLYSFFFGQWPAFSKIIRWKHCMVAHSKTGIEIGLDHYQLPFKAVSLFIGSLGYWFFFNFDSLIQ